MPSVVANLKIKPDKIEEAKVFLAQLAKDTLKSEEGTLEYAVHQRQDDPTAFVFYERYSDEAAFKIHGQNLASRGAEFAPLLDGRPEIIMLEEI